MPDTLLILHVKGTETETAELPKHIVRTAVSEGKLTRSQLIWSPVDNSWKEAREFPDLLPVEHLILHVKGTEAETTELPKRAIRSALSKGEITHSQLIWSTPDNAWRQLRELPELLPSQKLAPAPARGAAVPVSRADDAIIPESPAGPVARAAAESAGIPYMRVEAPSPARSTRDFTVGEHENFAPFKGICIGLGVFILLILGGSYFLVDRPLVLNLGQTSYSNVPVFAHFGAFMQPNIIVIHIPASPAITPDNLTGFLVTLARSTPPSPITRDLYARVALTSGWSAQYSFSGAAWKELGDMKNEDKAELKKALLARLGNASGELLMPKSTLNEAAQQAARDQVWAVFVAHLTGKW